MKVDKLSISLEPTLGDQVREAARKSGKPLSGWLAEAAAAKLRREALEEFVARYERKHGRLTEEELRVARAELGLSSPVR